MWWRDCHQIYVRRGSSWAGQNSVFFKHVIVIDVLRIYRFCMYLLHAFTIVNLGLAVATMLLGFLCMFSVYPIRWLLEARGLASFVLCMPMLLFGNVLGKRARNRDYRYRSGSWFYSLEMYNGFDVKQIH